ncbi:MAG: hypothetical protein IPM54_12985 [Polyangiaceae bacterium]|nr:hypothetical protein [Polyangiaceae bacterium]
MKSWREAILDSAGWTEFVTDWKSSCARRIRDICIVPVRRSSEEGIGDDDRFAKRIEDGLERSSGGSSEPKSPWIEARSNAKLGGFSAAMNARPAAIEYKSFTIQPGPED